MYVHTRTCGAVQRMRVGACLLCASGLPCQVFKEDQVLHLVAADNTWSLSVEGVSGKMERDGRYPSPNGHSLTPWHAHCKSHPGWPEDKSMIAVVLSLSAQVFKSSMAFILFMHLPQVRPCCENRHHTVFPPFSRHAVTRMMIASYPAKNLLASELRIAELPGMQVGIGTLSLEGP